MISCDTQRFPFESIKDNNIHYNLLLREIDYLKKYLKEQNISFPEEDKIFNSIQIYDILKKETRLNNNSLIVSSTIYFKYILFFITKIKYIIKKFNNVNNQTNISLLSPNIITEFFSNYQYNNATKGNRYNNLLRTLKIIFKNENVIFPNKIFIEKKHKKVTIINNRESLIILKNLFTTDNPDIILLWYLCFNLGLSVLESSNLIFGNYNNKRKKIIFFRNKKRIRRNIMDIICKIIEYKKYDSELNDFLIFGREIKNTNSVSNRFLFIKNKFFGWLYKIDFISGDTKETLLNLFLTQRDSVRMSNIERNIYLNAKLNFLNDFYFEHINGDNIIINNKEGIIDINEYSGNEDNNFEKTFLFLNRNINNDTLNICEYFDYSNNLINDNQNNSNKIKFFNIFNDEDLNFKNFSISKIFEDNNSEKIPEILSTKKIKFNDDNNIDKNLFLSKNFFKYISFIETINQSLLEDYETLKVLSRKGEYPSLKVQKIDQNDYAIFAKEDISSNKLLFEISGEVLNYDEFLYKSINLKNNYFCFFEMIKNRIKENSLVILISDYGNISFFLREGNPINENVEIKTFFIPSQYKIITLAFSKKKIFKNEILNCLNKFINLY